MQEPELIAIGLDETFQFDCHPGVPCFNQCCRDLNQALTPYDVLQLRRHLKISWDAFLEQYAELSAGPTSGWPVASLRFADDKDRLCPFNTEQGCRVYPARPTSCRLYPLARALQRSRADGRLTEHFAVVKEPHCRGFEQLRHQTVRQYLDEQEISQGLAANDQLMELIALKNRLRPGPLSPEHQQWAVMAFYDLDRLKTEAEASHLPNTNRPLPDKEDDAAWLTWGLTWLRQTLFGIQ